MVSQNINLLYPSAIHSPSLGWTVTEVGRQPWIVYGMMKTTDAASSVGASQVGLSLIAFVVVYSLLGIACFYLLIKNARKGPDPIPALDR